MNGNDFVAIAETGSGKTLAYVLPLLVHVMAQDELQPGEGPVGLVIVPTRHLCNQVADTINDYARRELANKGFKCVSVFGNIDDKQMSDQESLLQHRCDVMVATPGRLASLLKSKTTNLCRATYIVLDEADELLRTEFSEQIGTIVHSMRDDRQVMLFSATWPSQVAELARDVMRHDPLTIIVGGAELAASRNVVQSFQMASGALDKMRTFGQKLKSEIRNQLSPSFKVIVFVNKKESVSEVVSFIRQECDISCVEGYGCGDARGCQNEQDELLRRFSSPEGDCHLIVATQVLGRGLDIAEIRWVINLDMPMKLVEYVHRVGRTGRGDEKGFSWTLLEDHDMVCCRQLKKMLEESSQAVPSFIDSACKHSNFQYYVEVSKKALMAERTAKEEAAKRTATACIVPYVPPLASPQDDVTLKALLADRAAKEEALKRSAATSIVPYVPPLASRRQDDVTLYRPSPSQYLADLESSIVRQYSELRDSSGYGPQWYCLLCHKYIDHVHLASTRHQKYARLYEMRPWDLHTYEYLDQTKTLEDATRLASPCLSLPWLDETTTTITFQPGFLGFTADDCEIGAVNVGGQAERLGVEKGWRIRAVRGKECTSFKDELFDAARHGRMPFDVTFSTAYR
jgi:superfamily II DNA/RNA helicase